MRTLGQEIYMATVDVYVFEEADTVCLQGALVVDALREGENRAGSRRCREDSHKYLALHAMTSSG